MMDISKTRDLLQTFDFSTLFIEELGWSQPTNSKKITWNVGGVPYEGWHIAQLSGVVVLEIVSSAEKIPDAKTRAAMHQEITQHHHENLLIFLNKQRTQSIWYWVKREDGKSYAREHSYFQGQPGDLFLSKLAAMVFDIHDFERDGGIPVPEVAARLKTALDVAPVTKKFYQEFQQQHLEFLELIQGIKDKRQQRWYASVLLNRLMFIYFLQKKGFLDNGKVNYLQEKLEQSRNRGKNLYYQEFLQALFFEGFAKPENKRSQPAKALLGNITYLNGGLFLPHPIEQHWPKIQIADDAFDNTLKLFASYSWNLNDTPGGQDNEINPDVLGYIFEKYINQKEFGAYYTRPEITSYLCEQTIHRLLLDKTNSPGIPGIVPPSSFDSIDELLRHLDAPLCRKLVGEVLPNLTLLDPACGSGAFLIAAMKTLVNIYSAVIGQIHTNLGNDNNLNKWLTDVQGKRQNLGYAIKKLIVTDNLFGVDFMEEATEIARLRLFLALVASAQNVAELEPLPNIDFNTMTGNSLIGLTHIHDKQFDERQQQGDLFRKSYNELLTEKSRLIKDYRHASSYAANLRALRDNIEEKKAEAMPVLHEILLEEFNSLGSKFEESTWDTKKNQPGKSRKRSLTIQEIEALRPFHWGYEFDEILGKRGGFDAIITNPPWEIFKPQAKEFFAEYSELITKKKMTIQEFEEQQEELLQDEEIRAAWLHYLSQFPHLSHYYRHAPQYQNQISVVNGKKAGTDINLYKLFVEQCYNLLAAGGQCGIVLPSGIYTDLGAKQLREMLFTQTQITGLFCFENRKAIFEGVDSRFKFVVLTFRKGGKSEQFPAAFMRHEVKELARFPQEGSLPVSVELVRRLSPDSLSVMEFKNPLDLQIAEKMLQFPLLGEKVTGTWNVQLAREFDMTQGTAATLVFNEKRPKLSPLYEGKMIWQFEHEHSVAKFWVDINKIRKYLLGQTEDVGQQMDYQKYRLVFRRQASSTNTRTLVSTIIPPAIHSDNLASIATFDSQGNSIIHEAQLSFLCAIFNSFTFDYTIRQRVTANINFFYVYQLPVPRLTVKDTMFKPIVTRAARLICTTAEFDELAREVGLESHKNGVTDAKERARLRAELDGMIAHLYRLTEEEFVYILTTFPLVEQATKDAAHEAYRRFAGDPEIASLIAQGESDSVEFKEAVAAQEKKGVIKTVAAFLNSQGGTLLLGVANDGTIKGLEEDYQHVKGHNRDGFELFLTDILLSALGKENSPFIKIIFHEIQGKDICRVLVQASKQAVFYKDGKDQLFFIRTGNSSRQLSPEETLKYLENRCKVEWGVACEI
jgi:hypothetical protein